MKIKGLYHMPGSNFYWYRWTEDGKRHAVSLKTDNVSEAITKIKGIQAGAFFARWERAEPLTTPTTKIVENYLTAAQKRPKKPMRPGTASRQGAILIKFLRDCGIEAVHQITHKKISDWLRDASVRGVSKDTIHTYARALKTFVRWLEDSKLLRPGLYPELHVPDRAPVGRKNWLKADECERVIRDSKDPTLTFVLYCGFHTGLRRNEIAQVRVGWFDLDAGLLHVQNDPQAGFVLKDRENRTVPLTSEFKKFLAGFLAHGQTDEYAIAPTKEKGRHIYRIDFRKSFYSHMRRCGLKCSIYDMRRSFASNLVSHGVSMYKVTRWLGDGVQVVERSYGHLTPADSDIDRLTNKDG
jgi:integrase